MTGRFWLLDPPPNQPRAEEMLGDRFETITCARNPGHQRPGRRLSTMSVMVHPLGLRDFTWVWGADPLISRTPLSVFEKYRVTGFEVKPVNVTYPKGIKARPPELFELIVTGWGGLPAPSAGLSVIESCRDCGHTVYAIAEPSQLIDATAWDGSDLFIVWPLPGFPLVSDRVADIIRHEQVSGVKLVPAQEIRLKRGDTVTPGPLNMHMPEDRARELCKRFGI